MHGNVKYPCDQCEYAATQKTSLKRHIESDQCEYAATQKSALKRHI